MGSTESYEQFGPLMRIVKTSFITTGDFGVGLVIGTVIDKLFDRLVDLFFKDNPIKSLLSTVASNAKYLACHASQTIGEVQNPACADIPILDGNQLKNLLIYTLLQLITTMVVGLELRNLFIPYEWFGDPTGGIVFVIAIMAQPGLWAKSRILIQQIYQALWWLEQPQHTQS